MTVAEVREYISRVAERASEPPVDAIVQSCVELKRRAVADLDQAAAKEIWQLESVLEIQSHYLSAFESMKAGNFYQAWCGLEQAEIQLSFLDRHRSSLEHEFRIDFIREHVPKWQSLFPYRLFISPEILELEKRCSICHALVLPRTGCGHRLFEIYDGEMCGFVVTRAEFLAIALVEKPVQKYSVPFIKGPEGEDKDHYNYGVVEYLISALNAPFDPWSVDRQKRRQPHSRFMNVSEADPCPCESGESYLRCCLTQSGVLRPHLEFIVPLQSGLPSERYLTSLVPKTASELT
jgi:hypothetical protein